jgi:hypothetical protein
MSDSYSGFTNGATYYDFTAENATSDGMNANVQNYILALANLKKIEVDISYCLSNTVTTNGHPTPYREFVLVNGSKLNLSGSNPQMNPGSTLIRYGDSGASFDTSHNIQRQRNFCNKLYNNSNNYDTDGVNVSQSSTLEKSNGLYDIIYKEYLDASEKMDAYTITNLQNLPSYSLMDKNTIDASYQNIQTMRHELDKMLQSLYNNDATEFHLFATQLDATIFTTMLWTILAVALLYYAFIHL